MKKRSKTSWKLGQKTKSICIGDQMDNNNRLSSLAKVGYDMGRIVTGLHSLLPEENKQPFYLDNVNKRYRVHSGIAGIGLTFICLLGRNSEDETIRELSEIGLGLGAAMIEADKDNMDRWLPDLFR